MKLKTQFKSAEDSPGFLLWKAANRLTRYHNKILSHFDLTNSQFSLLATIVYLQQKEISPLTQVDLAQHSGMDKMQVSDLIKIFVKKKFIIKKSNLEDKRSFHIIATDQGISVVNLSIPQIEAADKIFFNEVASLSQLKKDLLKLTKTNPSQID